MAFPIPGIGATLTLEVFLKVLSFNICVGSYGFPFGITFLGKLQLCLKNLGLEDAFLPT